MLKKLLKDIEDGENILLESPEVTIIISHGAAWVLTEKGRFMVTGPKTDDAGILTILSKSNSDNSSNAKIIELIRPSCKPYDLETVQKELRAEITKRGINKIYHQLAKEPIKYIISTAALIENLTGKTIETATGKVEILTLEYQSGRISKFLNPPSEFTKKVKAAAKDGAFFEVQHESTDYTTSELKNYSSGTITIREAIDLEKSFIDPYSKGLAELLLFWSKWPAPYKSSQLLFEKADNHNRPETWKDLPIPFGDQLKILSEELDTKQGIITAYDYIAVFDVLARLQRITRKDRFWVVKGKVSNEVIEKAKKKDLVLIETDRIKELTGIDNTDKLKRVKDALSNTPRLFWRIRAKDRNDKDVSIKIAVAFTSMIIERDLEGVKGIERVTQLRLNDDLFSIKDDRFVLVEPQSYSRLLALPLQSVNPAARLFTHLMAYSNSFNGSRTAFIGIEKAAGLLGIDSWLATGQPARALSTIEDYLDKLKETGIIEYWKRQDNGAYKITIGV